MQNLYMFRELKLNDFEIFRFNRTRFGELLGYLAFIDFKRPSRLDDFPYLNGIEDPDGFGSENFIKALFISNRPVDSDLKEYLMEFSDSFIGNKDNCDWNIDTLLVDQTLAELSIMDLCNIFSKVLLENYKYKLTIPTITAEKFSYLSQN